MKGIELHTKLCARNKQIHHKHSIIFFTKLSHILGAAYSALRFLFIGFHEAEHHLFAVHLFEHHFIGFVNPTKEKLV